MNSKSLYWIALGIFALGFNSAYQKGSFPVAHRLADRAEGAFCRVSTRAEQAWALARVLTGHQDGTLDDQFVALQQAELARMMAERQADIDRVMAQHQADFDRALDLRQADLDRVQRRLERLHVVMDRVQVQNLRKFELVRLKVSNANGRRVVVCPKTGIRVMVDDQPVVADSADIPLELDRQ